MTATRIRSLYLALILGCLLVIVMMLAERRGETQMGTIGDWRGTYVPHAWVAFNHDEPYIIRMVEDISVNGFQYQIHNIGVLNVEGRIPAEVYPGLGHWMSVSRAVNPDQKIIFWINGDEQQHVNNPELHAPIAQFIRELADQYNPDGIWLDLEPFSQDNPLLLQLLQTVRAEVPDRWLTINAPATVAWSDDFVGEVAVPVDAISPMYYDSDLRMAPEYIQWVSQQSARYIDAMGAEAAHIPSIPAYEPNENHDPAIENIVNALQGLEASDRASEGVAVFMWHEFDALARSQWRTNQ